MLLVKRLERELKTWRNLQHPNILPLLGTCTDLGVFPFALPLPSMITEYCPLGTLSDVSPLHVHAYRIQVTYRD
jgi:serine/threonine protein kinase